MHAAFFILYSHIIKAQLHFLHPGEAQVTVFTHVQCIYTVLLTCMFLSEYCHCKYKQAAWVCQLTARRGAATIEHMHRTRRMLWAMHAQPTQVLILWVACSMQQAPSSSSSCNDRGLAVLYKKEMSTTSFSLMMEDYLLSQRRI